MRIALAEEDRQDRMHIIHIQKLAVRRLRRAPKASTRAKVYASILRAVDRFWEAENSSYRKGRRSRKETR